MKKTKVVPYRRKRERKTHYGRRLKLLLSRKPRLVIRRFSKNITAQIVDYNPAGDEVVASAHSRELVKMGWKGARGNIPAAYLTGLLCGAKAGRKGIKDAVLDISLHTPVKGSVVYAALKGVLDAGVNVPHSEEILPPEDRLYGKHIGDYAKKLSASKECLERQFGGCLKRGFGLENFKKSMEEVKAKILKS